jgi:hypothetical protein
VSVRPRSHPRRPRPALLPVALVAACLGGRSAARAADGGDSLGAIVVVLAPAKAAPEQASEVRRRTAAELAAAGFRVSPDGCAPGLQIGCAEPWPAGARAVVVVGFAWAAGAVTVDARIARSEDERPVRLQAVVAGLAPPEPAVVAVRATELVRAGALALLQGEPAPRGLEPPAGSAPRALAAAFLEAGPALVQSTAGLGGAWGPRLRAGVAFGERAWFAAAWLVAPTLAAELASPEGRAELRAQVGGLELGRRWQPVERLGLTLALGAGGYHLAVQGKEVAPLPAAHSSLWTPFGAAGGGVAWAFARRWEGEASLRVALLQTAPVVRIGASRTGSGGRPLLIASVSVVFRP